jgi:hypothetical protein
MLHILYLGSDKVKQREMVLSILFIHVNSNSVFCRQNRFQELILKSDKLTVVHATAVDGTLAIIRA